MKIALLGYGKMGKVIEKIALTRGHSIVARIDKNTEEFDLNLADVAIDFSVPNAAYKNICLALNNDIPIISGTTGWLKDHDKVVELCRNKNGAFIYASNFSLGVNILFELNKQLAKMMKNLKDYDLSIEEIHHTQKQDAPSGTAISLAEDIIKETSFVNWSLKPEKKENKIPILAKRIGNVPGTHKVDYSSEIDQIRIQHTAHNRQGFGLGAVIAAEWIIGKSGVFSMNDVLNIT
jgi:4-hydroxy-tetrahydrodipicolinate reductase